MDHPEGLRAQAGDATPSVEAQGHYTRGIQSVQDLEAVINEGLRAALLEEAPDQALEVLLQHLGNALKGERTYKIGRAHV